MITKHEYNIIRESWVKAITRSNSLGAIFYGKLFAKYPHLKVLFKGNKDEQARKLTYVLTVIFTKLNKIDDIENEVSGLAKRHVRYGVKPSNFEAFGEVLMDTMAIVLEDDWTSECKRAWRKMYTIITTAMIKAMEEEENMVA